MAKRWVYQEDCNGTPVEAVRIPYATQLLVSIGHDTSGSVRMDKGFARAFGAALVEWANEEEFSQPVEVEGAKRVEATPEPFVPHGSHNRQCPHCKKIKLPSEPDGACYDCTKKAAQIQR